MTKLQTLDVNYLKRIAERVTKEKQKPKVEPTIVPSVITPPLVNSDAVIVMGFIYVPSINSYVAKERILRDKNWFDCHKRLQVNGHRMPTIYEFTEFLKYLKSNPDGVKDAGSEDIATILDDILTVRIPYRGEWLDADFKVKDGKLYLNYNHEIKGGKLVPKNSEPLEACLMFDEEPGIDLDSWLKNSTKQGLPNSKVSDGSLHYYSPRSDNNSVAWFLPYPDKVFFGCNGDPSCAHRGLGVRAVMRNKEAIK